MGDQRLRNLQREYTQDSTVLNGRALYLEMFRHGRIEDGLLLRASLGYGEEVRALPRPTKEQSRAFAMHVADAHSWYKHLYEAEPFFFYLAPWAGLSTEGEEFLKEDCFHYNNVPTKEHLKRFGNWMYSRYEPPETVRSEGKQGVEIDIPEKFLHHAMWTRNIHGVKWPLPDYFSPGKPIPGVAVEQHEYLQHIRDDLAEGLVGLRAAFKAMDSFLKVLDEDE